MESVKYPEVEIVQILLCFFPSLIHHISIKLDGSLSRWVIFYSTTAKLLMSEGILCCSRAKKKKSLPVNGKPCDLGDL